MKFITMIALVFATTSAMASEYVSRKMSFSPMTHTGWNRTFYNCDWAERQVESHLKALGAQNVRVTCSGGIEWRRAEPVFINARFDAPVPAGNDVSRSLTLSGRENCSFNTEFLDKAIPLFPGVQVNSRRSSCSNGRFDSWKYELTVSE